MSTTKEDILRKHKERRTELEAKIREAKIRLEAFKPDTASTTSILQNIGTYLHFYPKMTYSQVLYNMGIVKPVKDNENRVFAWVNLSDKDNTYFLEAMKNVKQVTNVAESQPSTNQEYNRLINGLLLLELAKAPKTPFGELLVNTQTVIGTEDGSWAAEYTLEPKELLRRIREATKR